MFKVFFELSIIKTNTKNIKINPLFLIYLLTTTNKISICKIKTLKIVKTLITSPFQFKTSKRNIFIKKNVIYIYIVFKKFSVKNSLLYFKNYNSIYIRLNNVKCNKLTYRILNKC